MALNGSMSLSRVHYLVPPAKTAMRASDRTVVMLSIGGETSHETDHHMKRILSIRGYESVSPDPWLVNPILVTTLDPGLNQRCRDLAISPQGPSKALSRMMSWTLYKQGDYCLVH